MKNLLVNIILMYVTETALTEVVKTPSGQIRGKAVDFEGEVVHQFLRIPYAKNPIGDLRFRKPQPYGSWSYTLDATKHPPSCPQTIHPFFDVILPTLEVSEDCLFLNIYVPRDVSTSNNKAVMVWIHGGGFFIGQATMYDGSDLAMKGDVIVVTINYRLGMLGFFTTEDAASPGNYGFWDQRMAIEWVKSNIASFGGNPSSITIFGESAGGMSVGYQTLFPYNRGLFQRAISQSGFANMYQLKKGMHQETLSSIRELTPCGEQSSNYEFVDCLRHLPVEKIVNITNTIHFQALTKIQFTYYFGPAIDGDLFKTDPSELLDNFESDEYKFFKSVDFMGGTTDGEGSVFISIAGASAKENITEGLSKRALCDVVAPKYAETYYESSSIISDAICRRYSSPDEDLEAQGIQIADLLGDVLFTSHSITTLDQHAASQSSSKTFQYLLTRSVSIPMGPPTPWYTKAPHGTDLLYMFAPRKFFNGLNNTYTEEDESLTRKMILYWSNFAKTGNPNGDGLPVWAEYDVKDKSYLQLDYEISANKHLFSDRMKFIKYELPELFNKARAKEEL